MKAWTFYDFGDMRLEDIPDPVAKPGWVVCKVRRVQPSITDAQRAIGIETMGFEEMKEMFKKQKPIQMLGHEMSAEVVEVGSGVSNFKIGDRVLTSGHIPCGKCDWCRAGRDSWCSKKINIGITIPGAFAEKIALPEAGLLLAPKGLDDASIACLQPLSTTVAGIRDSNIKPGQTVAITGQGVMGIYMLQAARINGAGAVYVTDVRDEALALSRKFLADAVIDAKKEDPIKRILELTHGNGVDIVFECAGGHPGQGMSGHTTLHQAFKIVRLGGSVIQLAGLVGDIHLDAQLLRTKGIKWIFIEGHGNDTTSIGAKWVSSGRIDVRSLVTHEVFGIENLPEVFEITRNKEKYKATNPCQLVLIK
jgi:threonine dehydrogenase-like Zn-dependent dehydrogenase